MGSLDFYVEFNIEVENLNDNFKEEADRRLFALAEGKNDILGASVSAEVIVKVESPYLYQVRIVVYKRPKDIAAIEKDEDPVTALKNALSAIERIVHESREKRSEASIRTRDDLDMVVYEMSPVELYSAYVEDEHEPADVISVGLTNFTSKLMVDEGLSQEAAYYAAERILRLADQYENDPEIEPPPEIAE
jgi:ribosome-associated translation inhibitor RaiA